MGGNKWRCAKCYHFEIVRRKPTAPALGYKVSQHNTNQMHVSSRIKSLSTILSLLRLCTVCFTIWIIPFSQLSLSTNMIERMGGLKLPLLRVLSLGRNKIKKIDCPDLGNSLQEVKHAYGAVKRVWAQPLRNLYHSFGCRTTKYPLSKAWCRLYSWKSCKWYMRCIYVYPPSPFFLCIYVYPSLWISHSLGLQISCKQ